MTKPPEARIIKTMDWDRFCQEYFRADYGSQSKVFDNLQSAKDWLVERHKEYLMNTKRPCYAYCFKSSNGSALYETLQYTDGSLSCDCPGWTRRVSSDGSRTCKHVRSVQIGTAQVEAIKHNSLTGEKDLPAHFPLPKPDKATTPSVFKPYQRKFRE